jgi:hypothetical protein
MQPVAREFHKSRNKHLLVWGFVSILGVSFMIHLLPHYTSASIAVVWRIPHLPIISGWGVFSFFLRVDYLRVWCRPLRRNSYHCL